MPEEEIKIGKVPPKVRKAADAAVPGAKWSSAFKDEDEGMTYFELEGEDGRGRTVVVEVDANGKVGEIATEIAAKEVPKEVAGVVRSFLPAFKASAVFEVREEGKITGYESEGKRPQDQEELVVFVTVDAKRIEIDLP